MYKMLWVAVYIFEWHWVASRVVISTVEPVLSDHFVRVKIWSDNRKVGYLGG